MGLALANGLKWDGSDEPGGYFLDIFPNHNRRCTEGHVEGPMDTAQHHAHQNNKSRALLLVIVFRLR